MRSSIDRFAEKAMQIARKSLEEARTKVRKESASEYKQDLETVYAEAVHAWYDSYIPYQYNRTGKLYGLFESEIDAEGYVNWEISEDLSYPSWGKAKKPWDPFKQIFEHGLHGGWIGRWPPYREPVRSAPIPDLFLIGEKEIKRNRLLDVKKEFYDVFWSNYK